MNPDELRQYLEFYKDLGVKNLYIRETACQPRSPLLSLL